MERVSYRSMNDTPDFRDQHKLRLSWMPWLYASLKERHRTWAVAWQVEIQDRLRAVETIVIGANCFIAPEARLFGEPGRGIVMGDRCSIAADAFLHGPITLGNHVSINARASLDGGTNGIVIGEGTRIATGAALYALTYRAAPGRWFDANGFGRQGHNYYDAGTLAVQVGAQKGKARAIPKLPAATQFLASSASANEDKNLDAAKTLVDWSVSEKAMKLRHGAKIRLENNHLPVDVDIVRPSGIARGPGGQSRWRSVTTSGARRKALARASRRHTAHLYGSLYRRHRTDRRGVRRHRRR